MSAHEIEAKAGMGSSIKDVRKNIAKTDPPSPLVRFCPHQDKPPSLADVRIHGKWTLVDADLTGTLHGTVED